MFPWSLDSVEDWKVNNNVDTENWSAYLQKNFGNEISEWVLWDAKTETKCQQNMVPVVPDHCYNRPFLFDVVERRTLIFTSESSKKWMHIDLQLTCFTSGGQLYANKKH